METQYLIGVFDDEQTKIATFRKMKEEAMEIEDVFTPYPIHEILDQQLTESCN